MDKLTEGPMIQFLYIFYMFACNSLYVSTVDSPYLEQKKKIVLQKS